KMASRERRDVYVFFRDLAPTFREMYIAQGNHDGMLKNIVPRTVRFKPAYGFRIGDVGFCHGHAWPYKKVMEGSVLVMGHNHPAAARRDAVEVAGGFPSNRGARDSLLAMDFDRDGSATRNPPLHGRHPRSGPDGDAPRPASLVHAPDRVARRPHGLRMVLRPISAADR